jgi:protein-S-isoprenylcysteine O-methyltransferase Ste14
VLAHCRKLYMDCSKPHNTQLRSFLWALLGGSFGFITALILLAFPLSIIRNGIVLGVFHFGKRYSSSWQELTTEIVFILSQVLYFGKRFAAERRTKDPTPFLKQFARHNLEIGQLIFVFLYVASGALCQKLGVGSFHLESKLTGLVRTLGLLLVSGGAVIQVLTLWPVNSAFIVCTPFMKRCFSIANVRHPIYFSWFLVLLGLPLVLDTWLPLVAIPGVFVVLRWTIRYKESQDKVKQGTDHVSRTGAQPRWYLIPFLY